MGVYFWPYGRSVIIPEAVDDSNEDDSSNADDDEKDSRKARNFNIFSPGRNLAVGIHERSMEMKIVLCLFSWKCWPG